MMDIRDAWVSQFDEQHVPGAGPTACFRACRVICKRLGYEMPEGTVRRWQLALGEDEHGHVTAYDPIETAAATRYMQSGAPAIVGINYKSGSMNRDKITDHFVVLCGMMNNDGEESFLGLNPGAELRPGYDFNVAFQLGYRADDLVRFYQRSFPVGLRDTTIAMVVPYTSIAALLPERA